MVPASLVQLLQASTSQQSRQGDWGLEEGWWGAIHPSTTQEPDPNPSGAQVLWTHLPLLPWDMPTGPRCPHSRNEETTAQGAGHRPRCSWTLKPNPQHSFIDCGGPGVGWARSQKLWGGAPNASLLPAARQTCGVLPSLLVSICLKILSVRFSGVDSSSGIFITEDTILYIACKGEHRCVCLEVPGAPGGMGHRPDLPPQPSPTAGGEAGLSTSSRILPSWNVPGLFPIACMHVADST